MYDILEKRAFILLYVNTCCTNNGNYYQNEHFYWHISRVVMYANVVLVLVLIKVYDNILPNRYKTEK